MAKIPNTDIPGKNRPEKGPLVSDRRKYMVGFIKIKGKVIFFYHLPLVQCKYLYFCKKKR